jgi:hypothetical protein
VHCPGLLSFAIQDAAAVVTAAPDAFPRKPEAFHGKVLLLVRFCKKKLRFFHKNL